MGLSASKSSWVPYISGMFAITDVMFAFLIFSSNTCWGSYVYCLDAVLHVLGAIGYSTKADWMMHTQQYFGIIVLLAMAAFNTNHLAQFASFLTKMGYGQQFYIHHPYYGQFVLSGITVLVVVSAMAKFVIHLKIGAYLRTLAHPADSRFDAVHLETVVDESTEIAGDVKNLIEAAEKRMDAKFDSWTERMGGYLDIHTKQLEAKFGVKEAAKSETV